MSELALLAEAQADPGAQRLLHLLGEGALRECVETPAAYDRFTVESDFDTWDRASQMIAAACLDLGPAESSLGNEDFLRIVWNGSASAAKHLLLSVKAAYVGPMLPGATAMMAGIHDAAKSVRPSAARALLTRLGIYYTHRFRDGNTRGGAVHERLATHGFSGSEADRTHMSLLALGRRGVIVAGMDIDPLALTQAYAAARLRRLATAADYDDGTNLPDRVAPFVIDGVVAQRTFDAPASSLLFAMSLAERHTGVVTAASYALGRGELDRYIVERPDGGFDFDADDMVCRLSGEEAELLTRQHAERKLGFLRELVGSFLGRPSIFGDWRAVEAAVRPSQGVPAAQ